MDFFPPFEVRRGTETLSFLKPDVNHHTEAQWNEIASDIGPGETRRLHLSTKGMTLEQIRDGQGLRAVHDLCLWDLELAPPPPWENVPIVGKKKD